MPDQPPHQAPPPQAPVPPPAPPQAPPPQAPVPPPAPPAQPAAAPVQPQAAPAQSYVAPQYVQPVQFVNPDVADIDPTKSNTMAACLSAFGGLVLLPGLGHFYLGRWGRGLAFCGGYILSFLTVIGWIGVWIWAVVDANRLAQQAKKYHTWAATQGTPAQPAAALPPAPPAQPPPPPSA